MKATVTLDTITIETETGAVTYKIEKLAGYGDQDFLTESFLYANIKPLKNYFHLAKEMDLIEKYAPRLIAYNYLINL